MRPKPATGRGAASSSRARPRARGRPTRDGYPALSALLGGYLHQDFVLDHKTPARALEACLSESNTAGQRALRDEWERFLDATAGLSWPQLREAFGSLGGAWTPSSREALQTAFATLSKTASGRGRARGR